MVSRRIILALVLLTLSLAASLGIARAARAYGYGIHDLASDRATEVVEVYGWMEAIVGKDVYATPRAKAGVFSFFPLLSNENEALAHELVYSARGYDALVGDMGTRNHFWTADADLDELPEGIGGVDNAWEVARVEWSAAVNEYQDGNRSLALWHLGHVLHLVEDMGQPAHTNSDLHGPTNRDSLEWWGGYDTLGPMYSWTDGTKKSPGPFFRPPSMQTIIDRVKARTAWEGRDEFMDDPALMDPNDSKHRSQLFWIMYVTNQWGNYFASDGESGNRRVRLGWVDYDALGFPAYLHGPNGGHISPQDEDALTDNEGDCGHPGADDECCDNDGDLTTIATWGYAASMRGAGGVIELFRRTIDSAPPVTAVELTRSDGLPYSAGTWTGHSVTVHFASASDPDQTNGEEPSGVWTMYGLIDDKQWAPTMPVYPITHLQTTFASTGSHTVQVRTADNAGNIEQRDISVKIDRVAPVVTWPGWRDSGFYTRCDRTVQARWLGTDVDSGMRFSTATLDGSPIVLNTYIDLTRLSLGWHTFEVAAYDHASNSTIARSR